MRAPVYPPLPDDQDATTAPGDRVGRGFVLPAESDATVPVWRSRVHWYRTVCVWLDSPDGLAACKRHHTSAETVRTIALALCSFADSATGRGVAAAVATIGARAGLSKTSAERGRRVLAAAGLAVERATGRHLTVAERAIAAARGAKRQISAGSVWWCTVPRTLAGLVTSTGRPTPKGSKKNSLSRDTSLTKRADARKKRSTTRRETAAPGAAHRGAAALIEAAPALGRGHVGGVVDALAAAGIDDRWTPWDVRQLVHRWTAAGIHVPATVRRPGRWVAWALDRARVDLRSTPPSAVAAQARAERVERIERERAEHAAARAAAASPATRARAREAVAEALAARRASRESISSHASGVTMRVGALAPVVPTRRAEHS